MEIIPFNRKPRFVQFLLILVLIFSQPYAQAKNNEYAGPINPPFTDREVKELYQSAMGSYLFPNNPNYPKPAISWSTFNDNFLKANPDINTDLLVNGRLISLIVIQVDKNGHVKNLGFADHNKPNKDLINKLRDELKKQNYNCYNISLSKGKKNKSNPLLFFYSLVGNPNLPQVKPAIDNQSSNDKLPLDTVQGFNSLRDTAMTVTSSDNPTDDPNVIRARYLGGEELFKTFIVNQFQYPARCMEQNISGYVMLRFRVNRNGVIDRITPTQQTVKCPEFTAEAIRILKLSPIWIPGTNNGKNISTWFQVPIRLSVN